MEIEGGSSRVIFWLMASRLSARNGLWPVSSSYMTTPRENKSVLLEIIHSLICSGDIYSGEPIKPSNWVVFVSCRLTMAILKSDNFISRSWVKRMLLGLISR